MEQQFNRNSEDLGNCVAMEHVNTTVPDQQIATLFYVAGLGLTRDPYMLVELGNMWINIGRNQIHMPTRPPQVLRGHTAIVLPSRQALLLRLAAVKDRLAGTQFAVHKASGYVDVISPWGNRIRCFEPDLERFGRIQIGMPYVELDVPVGTAEGIARFYREVIKAPSSFEKDAQGACARVQVGKKQYLLFRETDRPLPEYDGHHIQIYIADFSGPHRWLKERGLIVQESDQYQYRFLDIVDPNTAKPLYRLEHEVRSMTHPLYARPLVNRNPDQTNRSYAPGHDAMQPEFGH
jgi:hypothetical protein